MFSKEATTLAVQYAQQRISAGAKSAEISRELGLRGWTLQRWLGQARPRHRAKGFVEIRVKQKEEKSITVHGPGGIRMEGLTVNDVVGLLRGLGCSA